MKEWIGIVNMDQGRGPRAIVILDEELENPQMFSTADEIATLQKAKGHTIGKFEWFAFNVVTGEVEEL